MERKLRVYQKNISIVEETAVGIFENLVGEQKGFLLESYDKNYDRYSVIGVEPEEIITSKGNSLLINRDGEIEVRSGNPVLRLKEYFDEFTILNDNHELPFTGGFAGSLGYDFIRYTEELPNQLEDEIGIETIQLMLMTRFVVVDHVAETMTAVVLEEDNLKGKKRAENKLEELIIHARGCKEKKITRTKRDGILIKQSDTFEQFREKVEKIKQYIKEGHIFQTVLSQRWTLQTKQTGFKLYQDLRKENPSPYLFYFNFGTFEIIGSSPEMLVKQVGDKVMTCPIAGTRKRGRNLEEDQKLKEELLKDEKERAEHVMLVDLARNDMGRISEFGSVKVTRFMDVSEYSQVMHLVSLVEGKRKRECHPIDLVSSFLPAGTLSGAPKIRAMEIIEELEATKRGLYGGVTGYLNFSGNMDFCITIRTMIKVGDLVYLQAGAGIVADSVPEKEFEECQNKARALANILMEEKKNDFIDR